MENKFNGRKGVPTIGTLNSQPIVVYSDSQMPLIAKVLMMIMHPYNVGTWMYIVFDGIPNKQSA